MTPLHHIGEALRNALSQIPLGAARALFVTFLCGVLLWVLLLPKSQTQPPEGPTRLAENLKLWAALALIAQVVIYAFV